MTAPPARDDAESLLGRLPLAVYRTSPEGRFLAGNDALARLLGVASVDDLFDVDVASLYVDEDARSDMVARVEAGEEIPPEVIRVRRLDGEEIWVRVSSAGVYAEDGSVLYFEGALEDITAQRELDAQLVESNLLLDTLTRALNLFIAGSDPGVIFDLLLEDLLALTQSEYGFIAQTRVHEDGHRFLRTRAMTNIAWNDATRELFEKHGPRGMEFHNLETLFGRVVTTGEPVLSNDPVDDPRRGGSPYGHPPLDSFLGLPVVRGDEVIGMVAVANRIGGYEQGIVSYLEPFVASVGSLIASVTADEARRAAETREQAREQLYRAVVEVAVEAIVAFTEDGLIEAVNPAAESMFGRAETELIGRPMTELLARPDLFDGLATAARDGTKLEMEMQRADGTVAASEVSCGMIRLDEGTVITAIIRDVSEQKALETTLRAARDAAERASRAKDEFLAGMSHELRTPLNAVIGLASILKKQTHGRLNEKQDHYVEQIESSGRHLLSLINDILDLAKIEAEKFEPDEGPVDLNAIAENCATVMRETALAHGLSLATDLDPTVPTIPADERRIKQVVLNLLSNAVKFTPERGAVGIRTRSEDGWVAVEVWDEGIGIPADRLDEIFAPFEQIDSSLARSHEGTGLGLALSRKLIESQGGTLVVESEPGQGSTFTFRLPTGLPSATEPDTAGDAETPVATSRARVLIVEDHDVNRMIVVDSLTHAGYAVMTATDGGEALDAARTSAPDVILMDVQLPGRNGLSVTRELKAGTSTAHIPVIALTALAMKGDEERCIEAGCASYISKPCDPEDIVAAIEEVLAAP